MKKFLFAMIACAALAGCKDKGEDFVGEWKAADETITVTKAENGGYRAASNLDNPDFPFAKLEMKLAAESDSLLVSESSKKKAIELNAAGTITSHMRNEAQIFTKVN